MNGKSEIRGLTGLRGLATLMVLAAHLRTPDLLKQLHPVLIHFISLGWIGVPVFFALSGYLITHLALKEISQTGRFHLRDFYLRRSIRLWPLYFTASIIALLLWRFPVFHDDQLALAASPSSWGAALLFFSVNIVISVTSRSDNLGMALPFWTLAAEEQFYLCWGAVIRFCRREQLGKLTLLLFFILSGSRMFYSFTHFHQEVYLFNWRVNPFCSFTTLILGCVLALYQTQLSSWLKNNFISKWLVLPSVFLLVWMQYPTPLEEGWVFVLNCTVEIFCALLVMASLRTGPVERFLSCRFLRRIGELSYAIYAIHFAVFKLYNQSVIQFHWPFGDIDGFPLLSFCRDTLFLFMITWFICAGWERMERPLRSLRARFRPV